LSESPSLKFINTIRRSYNDNDELCWAGAWLYLATQDQHYLDVAEKSYEPGAAWANSWDEKNAGIMVGSHALVSLSWLFLFCFVF